MVIEVMTFRLASGVDEAAFLDADRRVQTEFVPRLPGFLRRTTARGARGDWVVIVLWGSDAEADSAAEREGGHPAVAQFTSLVERASVSRRRYTSLD